MTMDTSVVVARMQAMSEVLSSLGPALQAAAPSGDFQAVLEQASAELAGSTSPSTASADSGPVASLGLTSLAALSGLDSGITGAVTGSQVVADAEQYLGVPYQWGGTSPTTGFDCSGLVQHVYGDLGVSLPRTADEQSQVGTPVASLADAQPGDLVFFPGADGTASAPGHVGIYIGNGQMIDAPETGTDVQIQPVGQPCAIRRVLPTAADTSSSASAAPDAIPAGVQVPDSLVPLFTAAADQYDVPVSLLAAVAQQESGFDPNAVSSAGAEGLMQLMPGTAAGLGVDPFDPSQAIDGAAQLLGSYLQQYHGSIPLTLAAYNAGPGAVAEYGGVPPYAQTTNYVQSIMSMLGASS